MSHPKERVLAAKKGGLSREMQMVLAAMAALLLGLGGYYFWNMSKTPADTGTVIIDESDTTPNSEADGAAVVPEVDPDDGATVTAPPASGIVTNPDGIQTIVAGDGTVVSPDGTVTTPGAAVPTATGAPAGINPATPLAATPSRNPFAPLRLGERDRNGSGISSVSPVPSEGNYVPPSTSTVGSAPRYSSPAVTPAVSYTYGSTPSRSSSGTTTSGASGDNGSGTSGRVTTVNPGRSTTSGSTTPWTFGDSGTSVGGASPAVPSAPPAAGVTAPSLSNVGKAGRSSAASTASDLLSVGESSSLIRTYNDAGSDSETAESRSPLQAALKRQDFSFNGAVLGKVNTAIFNTSSGHVVVEEGQNLPDTRVKVKAITTDSVELVMGNETVKLGLNPLSEPVADATTTANGE